jgi:hypothetical protein
MLTVFLLADFGQKRVFLKVFCSFREVFGGYGVLKAVVTGDRGG